MPPMARMMLGSLGRFEPTDYAVLVIYLAAMVVMGFAAYLWSKGSFRSLISLWGCIVFMSFSTLLWGCWLFGKNTPGAQSPLLLFFDGLFMVRDHMTQGHSFPQFLLGKFSLEGWWYYFPVTFVLKTSVFFQGLLVLSVIQSVRKTCKHGTTPDRLVYHSLWFFPLFFMAFCTTSNLNLGIRHLMPVLPFLFAFVAVNIHRLLQTGSRPLKIGVVVLISGYAISSLLSYPGHMGFFTEWARRNPARYLSDSNIDWGQDLRRLSRFMDQHQIRRIRLDYFGPPGAPDGYLKDRYEPWSVNRGFPGGGWFAVSEFYIMTSRYYKNQGKNKRSYDFLDPYEPAARIGSSLRVYFFPDNPQNE